MKIIRFKMITLLFMLMAFLGHANNDDDLKGRYNKEKTISQTFDISLSGLVKVKNSYGNLSITSWDQNKVSIEVVIKTSGNNEEKVQERLNEIDVDFENSESLVSAITRFGNRNRNWRWNWGKRNNVSVQVNYTIKLPIKNSVNLSNDYGNIYLDRIDGHAKISCDYGKMEIGQLRGRNNELRFDYTSRSTFDYIESADIIADYSSFTVEKAGDLKVNADYSNGTIKEMGDLSYTSDYGSIDVASVQSVSGNGDYFGLKLGSVYGDVSLAADYGSIRIDRLTPQAGDVSIKSDYTGIKLGYDSNYSFDFEISTEYAGVKGKDAFTVNISEEKSGDKYYKGYHGSQNSGNQITINSEYGGITFYQN